MEVAKRFQSAAASPVIGGRLLVCASPPRWAVLILL